MSRRTVLSLAATGVLIATSLYAREGAKRPNTFGPRVSAYRVGAPEFTPIDTSVTYNDLGNFGSTLSRYATGCSFPPCELLAFPHLPSGALVTGVVVKFCDTNVSAHTTLIVFKSGSDGTGGTNIGQTTSTNIGGCGSFNIDLTPANFTVDNANNQFFFGTFFGALDGTNSISAVVVEYDLQVSPAPLTATFTDVPTSDFGFQFVEAFNRAGITVGCNVSPPMFCPDRNVTRREMAIFFAKALGLQFP